MGRFKVINWVFGPPKIFIVTLNLLYRLQKKKQPAAHTWENMNFAWVVKCLGRLLWVDFKSFVDHSREIHKSKGKMDIDLFLSPLAVHSYNKNLQRSTWPIRNFSQPIVTTNSIVNKSGSISLEIIEHKII